LRLPQPEGPDPRIYIPQEQGGPFVPPGSKFPFRHLLRLSGLRWRYSNPPPHGRQTSSVNSEKLLDSLSVIPSVSYEIQSLGL
jgi:hypothetical protein